MNNITCPSGWDNKSEFFYLTSCAIDINVLWAFRIACIAVSSLCFLGSCISLIAHWGYFKQKKPPTKLLIISSCIQPLIMTVRPIISLTTGLTSVDNLGVLFTTSFAACMAACVVCLFVYIEVGVIRNSELRKTNAGLHKGNIIAIKVISATQVLLFLVFPFVQIRPSYAFWIPVVCIVLVIIPYFLIMGGIVYHKIAGMQGDVYKRLRIHLLYTLIVCGILGLTVCVFSFIMLSEIPIAWIGTELVWTCASVFMTVVFALFIRKQEKYTNSSSSGD